jgi:flavin-dependent dehydrogenase
MLDVLIVGAGIAGSVLATLLGRSGLSVELFEQGCFPKEKPCGEGLMPGGVAALERMGLGAAMGGRPFYGVRYHLRDLTVEGRFPSVPGFPNSGLGQRRKDLDEALFRAASATPGVTTFTGTRVDGPLCEHERVVGVRIDGEAKRARLVVAADGMNSRFRHQLGLNIPSHRRRIGIRAHFRLASDREQPPWVDVFVSKRYELYVTPLPNREVLVAGLAHVDVLTQPIHELFYNWCNSQPILRSRLDGAQQVSQLRAASPLSGCVRAGATRSLVLLGDAAGSVDPITGSGMALALLTAELLAKHVIRNLRSDSEWLWDFERERKALLRDYRLLSNLMLCLSEHPRLAYWLLSTVAFWPGLVSHFVGVSGGVRGLWGRQLHTNCVAGSCAAQPLGSAESLQAAETDCRGPALPYPLP